MVAELTVPVQMVPLVASYGEISPRCTPCQKIYSDFHVNILDYPKMLWLSKFRLFYLRIFYISVKKKTLWHDYSGTRSHIKNRKDMVVVFAMPVLKIPSVTLYDDIYSLTYPMWRKNLFTPFSTAKFLILQHFSITTFNFMVPLLQHWKSDKK